MMYIVNTLFCLTVSSNCGLRIPCSSPYHPPCGFIWRASRSALRRLDIPSMTFVFLGWSLKKLPANMELIMASICILLSMREEKIKSKIPWSSTVWPDCNNPRTIALYVLHKIVNNGALTSAYYQLSWAWSLVHAASLKLSYHVSLTVIAKL